MGICGTCGGTSSGGGEVCPRCGAARGARTGAEFLEIDPPDAKLSGARVPPAHRPPVRHPPVPRWRVLLSHPAAAFAIGLIAVPVGKALFLPGFVFNFLTTLVHEIGHCACAWLMGMPSIPAVSPGGGGVTRWWDQQVSLVGAWLIAWAWLASRLRDRRPLLIAAVAGGGVHALLAFTSAHELFVIGGGVLFEIAGAGLCFYRASDPHTVRPIERPLYALWGWWMLMNRGGEAILMLRDRAAWDAAVIYESGLAAGLTNDLELVRDILNVPPQVVLKVVLLACVLCLPAALGMRWLRERGRESAN
ncbi:MAG: hypothetical protein HUU15_05790 [Candidatus Brocadiae bacterium]|nr:hypothetical protein [Candidatus Brocadiia bacterium]